MLMNNASKATFQLGGSFLNKMIVNHQVRSVSVAYNLKSKFEDAWNKKQAAQAGQPKKT